MHEIVKGELPAPAVLEPLLADLVAAHVKLPDLLGDALEVLRLVDVDVARFSFLVDHELGKALLHDIVARHRIAGEKLGELGRLQQMQRHEFLAQDAQLAEEFQVGGQRHAGEVDLQELCVALAVGGRVEDGVDVIEDVLRAEGGGQVAVAVGDEREAEAGSEGRDEIMAEVGDAMSFCCRYASIAVAANFNLYTRCSFASASIWAPLLHQVHIMNQGSWSPEDRASRSLRISCICVIQQGHQETFGTIHLIIADRKKIYPDNFNIYS